MYLIVSYLVTNSLLRLNDKSICVPSDGINSDANLLRIQNVVLATYDQKSYMTILM